MNKIKLYINDVLSSFGYQLRKAPFSKRQIASGHFKWLQELDIQTILDVGANEGQFLSKASRIFPDAYFYAFEPLKKSFTKLQKNNSANKKITLFNFALGDEEKDSIINRNDYSPSSSLLPLTDLHKEAFPMTENVVGEKIQIRLLDNIASHLNLNKKILLKIDVQGYELNVLRGAERTLKAVDVILTETSFFELYKNQPLFDDMYTFLSQRGFQYFGSLEQLYDARDGRILQADSIFIRK
ncbi:MAG: FkbM family methyltransferase [Bacteroidota bacterium]|nr:FkbM family methyltransferase [Bacteroidota bacterium]